MGLILRLVLLVVTLGAAGSVLAWLMAEMFATAREILVPFVILSAAILAGALGYLVSTFRRR